MHRTQLTFAVLMLIAVTHSSHAQKVPEDLPEPFTGVYSFNKDGMYLGETVRTLSRIDEGHFIFKSVSRATGMQAWIVKDRLIEQSEWAVHRGHPRPLSYEYHRQGGRRERHVRITFDWRKLTATNNIGHQSWRMAVPGETMDKLLFQLALMIDLARGKQVVEYPIADGGRLKRYRLKVIDSELVTTPLGRFKALKVQRLGDQRKTTLWCAPELHYLPVRIEQVTQDSRVRLNLKALQRR